MIALCNACIGFVDDCVAEACLHECLVTCFSIIETAANTLATLITG